MSDEFLLSLYRFDPEKDERPYMSDYKISYPETGNTVSYTHLTLPTSG